MHSQAHKLEVWCHCLLVTWCYTHKDIEFSEALHIYVSRADKSV